MTNNMATYFAAHDNIILCIFFEFNRNRMGNWGWVGIGGDFFLSCV